MKALSIIQPWAWLIVAGHKPVENRSWNCAHRGPLAIHASKNRAVASVEYNQVADLIREWGMDIVLPHFDTLALGAVVGTVEMIGVVRGHASPWFFGPWGFAFEKPVEFHVPIPARGSRGLWDWAPE